MVGCELQMDRVRRLLSAPVAAAAHSKRPDTEQKPALNCDVLQVTVWKSTGLYIVL